MSFPVTASYAIDASVYWYSEADIINLKLKSGDEYAAAQEKTLCALVVFTDL
jgi:hypothetical protein